MKEIMEMDARKQTKEQQKSKRFMGAEGGQR